MNTDIAESKQKWKTQHEAKTNIISRLKAKNNLLKYWNKQTNTQMQQQYAMHDL